MRKLHLDFETYCDLDLKKVGIHIYVNHPSFRVLCVAWKIDSQTVNTRLVTDAPIPPILIHLLKDPNVRGHAWNAAFEMAVLRRLSVEPANALSCTMQRALSYGLPAKLETAAWALGVAHQKDMTGHRLMLQMTRPQKPGAKPWTVEHYLSLCSYCGGDVNAEADIEAVIPELQPQEQELSELDDRMNISGHLAIDEGRVELLRHVAAVAEQHEAARCSILTCGAVTSPGTQTARLQAWFKLRGIDLPDVSKDTIKEWIEVLETTGGEDDLVEVLQIRARTARASVKKLTKMLDMAGHDGAIRGQFQFLGAGRTGRWSGRGIQLQNFPRVPKGFSPDEFVRSGGADIVAPAPQLDCVSWSLRSCLVATSRSDLWSFDFSQIEARVLAWLAGQQDVLDVFRDPAQDVYVWAAAQFGSNDRQLGKVLILALGFGMGSTKLRETARKQYDVRLTMGEAEAFKVAWRGRNKHIVQFWYDIEFAARQAILMRGKVFAVQGSGIAFTCTARTLQMRLPSGRVLYYHKPHIDESGTLRYWGLELGQWSLQKTYGGKLAENATQAVARDIMAEAMMRIWQRMRAVPLMTVHDELVYALGKLSQAMIDMAHALMLESPQWAGGLPIAGEAKIMSRYSVLAKSI